MVEARLRVTLFWYKPSLHCYGNCSWKILVSIRKNLIYIIKQEGLYQNKVTLSLASIHNCKMVYCRHNCRPAEKADTTACFSICQSVNTGRRWRVKYLRVEANTSYEGTEKQLHFWISLVFSLVAKCNARFNKNVSQLKRDIRLQPCRWKNFSLNQASGVMGEGGARGARGASATALP